MVLFLISLTLFSLTIFHIISLFKLYSTLFFLFYSPIEGDTATASTSEYRQYQRRDKATVSYVNYSFVNGILCFLHESDCSYMVSYV